MTLEQYQSELKECEKLWSKYSCDGLHYYMVFLESEIKRLTA